MLTQAGVPAWAPGQSSSSSGRSASRRSTPQSSSSSSRSASGGSTPPELQMGQLDFSLLQWVYEVTSAVIPARQLPGSSDGVIGPYGGGIPMAEPAVPVAAVVGRGGGNDGGGGDGGQDGGGGQGDGGGDRGGGGGGRRQRAGYTAEARLAVLIAAAIQCIMDSLGARRDEFAHMPASERPADQAAEMLRIVSEAVIACLAELKRELQPRDAQVRMSVNTGMARREAQMITAIYESWLVNGIDAAMRTADQHMQDLHRGLFGELGDLNQLLLAEYAINMAIIQDAESRAQQAQALVIARTRDLQEQDENTQLLAQRLGQLLQDLHDTTGQLYDTGGSYMQAQDQIETLRRFITRLRNETVSRNTYEELQGVHRRLLGQIEELASNLAAQPGTSSSGGSDQMARLREAIRALREAQATLSSDLEESKRALQQAKEQMDEMDAVNAQEWSAWEATYKNDLEMLKKALEEKTRELSHWEDVVRRHQDTELNASAHIDALQQSIAALQAQIAQADLEGITRTDRLQMELDEALRQNQILQAIERRREEEAAQRMRGLIETGSLPGAQIDIAPQPPSANDMIGGDGTQVMVPGAPMVPLPPQTLVDGANAEGDVPVTPADVIDMFVDLPVAQGGGGDGGGGKVAGAVVLGIVAALAFGFFLYRRKRKRS